MRTSFYIQVGPEFTGGKLTDISAERMTKTKPIRPIGGGITVKLTIDIPAEAFLPLEPEAVIEIPVSHTHANPVVTVTSENPDDEPVE